MDPTGKEIVLYSFAGGTDGGFPYAGLVPDKAGNLYGTTYVRGTGCSPYGCGTVFNVNSAGKETVLYSFTGTPDGAHPYGLVRDSAGNLYGTTSQGGANGLGTVFKVDPTGKEIVLYSFTGGADGAIPFAGVVRDSAGNLYGTVAFAGANGVGTVFKVDRTGKEVVLYSFTGATDGGFPYAGLVRDKAGNLYGTALYSGAYGWGTVFKVAP